MTDTLIQEILSTLEEDPYFIKIYPEGSPERKILEEYFSAIPVVLREYLDSSFTFEIMVRATLAECRYRFESSVLQKFAKVQNFDFDEKLAELFEEMSLLEFILKDIPRFLEIKGEIADDIIESELNEINFLQYQSGTLRLIDVIRTQPLVIFCL